jgi:glutamate---cysteine ligase / carboxylate-amine ligase
MPDDTGLDMDRAREIFEASEDFTVGLEEEFAIVDPANLELAHRYEDLSEACKKEGGPLAEAVAGELIDTEIEIRSGKGQSFADAAELQRGHRTGLFAKAEELGLALAATGTHPWANYLDQRIIDTAHYRRLSDDLGWVALRNNTWSLHVHVGIQGADRAIAVCDAMRELLPLLLAASANSPFLDGRDTNLHTVRTQIFTRTFPRCGIHEPFRSWDAYTEFVGLLQRTRSIVEATQLWWSVRPHHRYGTVEVRICDAQTNGAESLGLLALATACVAQLALDYDDGGLPEPRAGKLIEENLWRAIRFGMDGKLIDFEAGEEVEAAAALDRVLEWTAPARESLGLDAAVPSPNGAQRAREALTGGDSLKEIYAAAVEETRKTYAQGEVAR